MKYLNFANHIQSNNQPEVLLTLVDFSGSMSIDDYKPSRQEGAIDANLKLIRTKAKQYPNDKIGIIVFHDEACVLHPPVSLATGANSLCQSLRDYNDSGGTDFTVALELAEKVFFKRPPYGKEINQSRIFKFLSKLLFETEDDSPSQHIKDIHSTGEEVTRRIIMLTDGHNGGDSPIKIANRLKDANVIIECIGIAGNHKDVSEKILKQIASVDEYGNPRYCFIGDSESLIRKYESMAHHIRAI
jgi:von Willebrand factor type A domain